MSADYRRRERGTEREDHRRGHGWEEHPSLGAAAWPVASSAVAHRRGPPPPRSQSRTPPRCGARRHAPAVTAPARAGRAVLPRRAP